MDQRRKSSFARHRRDRVCEGCVLTPCFPAQLPGDLGFDPLGLKPTNDKDLKNIATKELNNGRLDRNRGHGRAGACVGDEDLNAPTTNLYTHTVFSNFFL